jgi:hypothetical protein
MMRYHVETFSLPDRWVNTWTEPVEGPDDTYSDRPVTFATHLEAVAALNAHWAGILNSVAMGDVMPYDFEDFRIVQVEIKGAQRTRERRNEIQTPRTLRARRERAVS